MRTIVLIGIGAGDPDQLTLQAVKAIRRADVFFLVDKGQEKDELVQLRQRMVEEHAEGHPHRLVRIPDPPRDRAAAAYESAVHDWHHRRAQLFAHAFATELGEDGTGAFLVWGDPALYDSTLRILDLVAAGKTVDFDVEVVPGITSVQALAAAHRVPLNRIGEPIHITTGRHLLEGLPPGVDNAVVMLDGSLAFTQVPGDDYDIWWGANLGTPLQRLVAGDLREVEGEIAAERAELRAQAGWVMDTYLLRRHD